MTTKWRVIDWRENPHPHLLGAWPVVVPVTQAPVESSMPDTGPDPFPPGTTVAAIFRGLTERESKYSRIWMLADFAGEAGDWTYEHSFSFGSPNPRADTANRISMTDLLKALGIVEEVRVNGRWQMTGLVDDDVWETARQVLPQYVGAPLILTVEGWGRMQSGFPYAIRPTFRPAEHHD